LSGYLGLLRDKVAANWTPPLSVVRRGEVRAVIAFAVGHEGGAPRDLVVAEPSGDSNFDLSAMRAVARANPLPPFPSNYAGDSVVIRFTFFQEY
jgi:TonB family protein